jgi:hypothetical protein
MQKKNKKQKVLLPQEIIEQKIFLIRNKKVMLDSDLATMYGVGTKVLNLAVRRNKDKFPPDFMFQLDNKESDNLRFQIETSSYGGRRYVPYVFTEQGVAMLSCVLKSKRAVAVNIQIIRTFVKLREMIISNKELRTKIEDMERKYGKRFRVVFETLKSLTNNNREAEKIEKKEPIGFKIKK